MRKFKKYSCKYKRSYDSIFLVCSFILIHIHLFYLKFLEQRVYKILLLEFVFNSPNISLKLMIPKEIIKYFALLLLIFFFYFLACLILNISPYLCTLFLMYICMIINGFVNFVFFHRIYLSTKENKIIILNFSSKYQPILSILFSI